MSEANTKVSKRVVFTPYYINQERLLDMYAILNGGYQEYDEIKSSESSDRQRKGSAKASVSGGFRMFKLGGDAAVEQGSSSAEARTVETRRVQTTASMLGAVIDELNERRLIRSIDKADVGSIVSVPVEFKINSVSALIKEAKDLVALGQKMQAFGEKKQKGKGSSAEVRQLEQIAGLTKELIDAEEAVHEDDDLAIVGNLYDKHLYQGTRVDLIDTRLTCLAQVKRVFKDGTQLMKNTVFSKLADLEAKQGMVDALMKLSEDGSFRYDSIAKVEIKEKPVYQVEIIALYQEATH